MKEIFIEIYGRDILTLKAEIAKYKDEKVLWSVAEGISNSAGNLALHLVGNLNHFIGKDLGNTDYKRERDKEFSLKNIPSAELIDMIGKTRDTVVNTLASMNENDFDKDFPEKYNDKIQVTNFMLVHLAAHLGYHLGQINYHRRLLDK